MFETDGDDCGHRFDQRVHCFLRGFKDPVQIWGTGRDERQGKVQMIGGRKKIQEAGVALEPETSLSDDDCFVVAYCKEGDVVGVPVEVKDTGDSSFLSLLEGTQRTRDLQRCQTVFQAGAKEGFVDSERASPRVSGTDTR